MAVAPPECDFVALGARCTIFDLHPVVLSAVAELPNVLPTFFSGALGVFSRNSRSWTGPFAFAGVGWVPFPC